MTQLMGHHFEKANKQKLILSAFEWLSKLKTNIRKSELSCYREVYDEVAQYAELFG
jgi:hypothetical protein